MEEKIFNSLFQYLTNQESKKLVGKVMKRFDLEIEEANKQGKTEISIEKINAIKKEVKEILYEWLRDFRDSINTGKFILTITKEQK